jgi:outer membrane protein assembly factor BamB
VRRCATNLRPDGRASCAWLGFDGDRILKIDGKTGALRWSVVPDPVVDVRFGHLKRPIEVDAFDDVVCTADGKLTPHVLKLAGDDGTRLWSRDMPYASAIRALALDAAGDVFDVVVLNDASPHEIALALDGASGTPLWTTDLGATTTEAVALDGAGGVLIAGTVALASPGAPQVFAVTRLDRRTGRLVWQHRAAANLLGTATTIASDPSGEVFAGGALAIGGRLEFSVRRLSGRSGALRWSSSLPGSGSSGDGAAASLVVDERGNAVAAGTLSGAGTDFGVVSFSASDGRFGGCTQPGGCTGRKPIFKVPTVPRGRLPLR